MKLVSSTKFLEGDTYEVTDTVLEKAETRRGFGVINFLDRYNQVCSLQDSSLATEPAIWFGVDNTGPYMSGPSGERSEDVQNRMHLTQSMVKTLLPYLTKFAETGEYISSMEEVK
jgi:hypothetical protein